MKGADDMIKENYGSWDAPGRNRRPDTVEGCGFRIQVGSFVGLWP